MGAAVEEHGCTCGRRFKSKSQRTRHMNRCPEVLAYRERVRDRLERDRTLPSQATP